MLLEWVNPASLTLVYVQTMADKQRSSSAREVKSQSHFSLHFGLYFFEQPKHVTHWFLLAFRATGFIKKG